MICQQKALTRLFPIANGNVLPVLPIDMEVLPSDKAIMPIYRLFYMTTLTTVMPSRIIMTSLSTIFDDLPVTTRYECKLNTHTQTTWTCLLIKINH